MTETVTTVIASIGGTTAVLTGVFAWLGKVWASRIVEGEKVTNSKDLSRLNAQLDVASAQNIRNSDARFVLYQDVWARLQELNTSGNDLWRRPTSGNVISFAETLAQTRASLSKGRLIDLRKAEARAELRDRYGEEREVDQVRDNRAIKDRYSATLEKVLVEFRCQLGLTT